MHVVGLCLIYMLIAVLTIVENRKYDIEETCQAEFGMDLDEVIRYFRRSDDYLRMLSIRVKEFDVFFYDVIYQSFDWNLNKMRTNIMTDFGLSNTVATPTSSTDSPVYNSSGLRFPKRPKACRRQNSIPLDLDTRKLMEKVKRVDSYPKLKSHLSLNERNRYMDIGYEYAGEIFHAAIFAFGGHLNGGTGSTQLDVAQSPTTEHVVKHVPTHFQTASQDTPQQVYLAGRGNTRYNFGSAYGQLVRK